MIVRNKGRGRERREGKVGGFLVKRELHFHFGRGWGFLRNEITFLFCKKTKNK